MQTTGNLGLKKPEGTDIVDIADLNGNMDILDNTVTSKVDKVTGKQLSTNDYTTAEKTKLAGIAAGANNYAHPNHTGDVTSNGDGVTAIAAGVIVNADVNATAGIDASKIGTGVVSNTEFGYLDGVTGGIQGQLNGKAPLVTTPQQTTADITYYVRTDGNDNNTGLSNATDTAFKTWQKALDSLPKVINHTVKIYIADGTYNENVSVKGFHGGGTLTITGNTNNAALVSVTSVEQYENFLAVSLISVTATTTTKDAFTINRCIGFRLNECRAVAVAATYSGVMIYFSVGVIANGTYSNKIVGINASASSQIDVIGTTGTGNAVGIGSNDGSIITKSGVTITGNQLEGVAGGTITAGVLNPWGDNTLSSRSAVRASISATQSLAANTFTKLAFNTIHQDYSDEFNITLNRFVAKKNGWYLVTGGIGITTAPIGTAVSLIIFTDGYRQIDIGSFSPSGAAGGVSVYGSAAFYIPAGSFVELYAYPTSAVTTHFGSNLTSFTVAQIA
jgi:hypothetical protein